MMNPLRPLLALSFALTANTLCAQSDVKKPLSDNVLKLVPSPYREEMSHRTNVLTETEQAEILSKSRVHPEIVMDRVLTLLGNDPSARMFLLHQMAVEADRKIRLMVVTDGMRRVVRNLTPGPDGDAVEAALQQAVRTDSDPTVALEEIRDLRRLQWGKQTRLLNTRAAEAHEQQDFAAEATFRQEADSWSGWDEQLNLPNFLRTPPPVFEVTPPGHPIRVLAFGDFGNGSPEQLSLAKTMQKYGHDHPFDFGITLGDNFYPRGVASPDDPFWSERWEKPYGPLGIRFYASLGNHDYIQADGPAAEILYSARSATWRMPATHYTFTAGSVQFFAIDTQELSDTELYRTQIAWLDTELAKSKARWKVVYGHYQVYSATRGDERNLIERLMPVMRHRVDVYLCGHDHNMQELKTEDGVHFMLSGGGGAPLYPFDQPNYPRSEFKKQAHGFTVIEADDASLALKIIGSEGELLKQTIIRP